MNNTLTLNPSILIRHRLNLNLKLFWLPIFIITIVLLVLYIFQVNFLAHQTYLIKDFEKKVEELSKEEKLLEITLSKMDSLSNIENHLLNENFVKANPNQIKYIQILESSVAKNK